MKKLTLAIILVLSASALAWAFEINFPRKTEVKATVLVDELGEILFGDEAARIEITAIPKTETTPIAKVEQLKSFFFSPLTICTNGTNTALTVPANHFFILTDIESINVTVRVLDTGTPKLEANSGHRSYASGIAFGPSSIVQVCSKSSTASAVATLMGRLIPTA